MVQPAKSRKGPNLGPAFKRKCSGFVCLSQTAVSVWIGTRLAAGKRTLFAGGSATGWAFDGNRFLKAEFSLHREMMP